MKRTLKHLPREVLKIKSVTGLLKTYQETTLRAYLATSKTSKKYSHSYHWLRKIKNYYCKHCSRRILSVTCDVCPYYEIRKFKNGNVCCKNFKRIIQKGERLKPLKKLNRVLRKGIRLGS